MIDNLLLIIGCVIAFQYSLEIIEYALALIQFKKPLPDVLRKEIDETQWEKQIKYLKTNLHFGLIQSTTQVIITLILIFSPLLLEISRLISTSHIIWESIQFLLIVGVGSSILGMPFECYQTFGIEEKYGFNKTTLKTYCLDKIKQWALTLLIGVPVIYGLLFIIIELENAWIWASISLVVIQMVLMIVTPNWIMPLFNKFTPIDDQQIQSAITQLGEKVNYPIKAIMKMDGSRRSKKANAFFIGFGKTKRVVLYDTLMEMFNLDQILAVLAHEIGHFKRKHLPKLMVTNSATILIMFFLLDQIVHNASVSKAFGLKYEIHKEAFKILESYYKPGEFNIGRQKMCWMPEKANLILNPTSGAPGFNVENVFCLPGVPSIMKSMLGSLKNKIIGGEPILSHTISLRTVESEIADKITMIQDKNEDVEIGSYPFFHAGKLGVSIVLRSENQSKIDTCNNQILEFVNEKKIEIVDR